MGPASGTWWAVSRVERVERLKAGGCFLALLWTLFAVVMLESAAPSWICKI